MVAAICGTNLDEWLLTFFAEYQKVRVTEADELSEWLPHFFDEYQQVRVPNIHPKYAKPATPIDIVRLDSLLKNLEGTMPDARNGAFLCDPWELACLGKDEVRNSAVLAWLLNPRGNHGIGDKALIALLKALNFPTDTGKYCHVRTESSPTGEIENRVDIEIDSEKFYMIVEVKIGALEGDRQIERYGAIAEELSGGRSWTLLFLTIKGEKPKTAGKYSENVCCLSWKELAMIIQNEIKPVFMKDSASKTASRVMTEQIVLRFLKRMQSY